MRIVYILITLSFFNCTVKKKGSSKSVGKVNNGSLVNGVKFNYKKDNISYFSFTSYYILHRSYVHEKVKKITLNAYENLNKKHPKQKWGIMECSRPKGGKMKPHRTHQNGTSIDFMTPLKWVDSNKQYRGRAHLGVWHYLLNFDKDGYLNKYKNVQIDFNILAEHILALQKAAKKEGWKIKKVILKINLKDNLFKSVAGKKLKKSGIYFAQYLTPMVDNVHDDHYHIDFAQI